MSDRITPTGGNLYSVHYLVVNSGTFWRCRHGKTGFRGQCWRCGIFHPFQYLRNRLEDWWYDHV